MARERDFRIEVDPLMGAWVRALSSFEVDDVAVREWQAVNDVYFSRTQQYAHVLSGDMKRSGRQETRTAGRQIITETVYGGVSGSQGRPVDYAIYEIRRGGSHDFIGRALNATATTFQQGLQDAVTAQMIDLIQNARR